MVRNLYLLRLLRFPFLYCFLGRVKRLFRFGSRCFIRFRQGTKYGV